MLFECRYCPQKFKQLKGLIEHYESRHNPETMKNQKDDATYGGVDSGCEVATEHLGHQSSCFKCPFRKCVLEEAGVGVSGMKKRRRDLEIVGRHQEGESVGDLALFFGVSKRTIRRALAVNKKAMVLGGKG